MNPHGSTPCEFIGVLLAAGRGRRMGTTKQLLPWKTGEGEKPLVAAAFDAISSWCSHMIVVLGHDAEKVATALHPRSFQTVTSNPDASMYESIRHGLIASQQIDKQFPILLHPADHPEVHPFTLSRLHDAWKQHPEWAVMPEYEEKGGHPVIIPSLLTTQLIEYSGEGGLRQFWLDHPDTCLRVIVDDPIVIRDMDTPDQYLKRQSK